MRVLIIIPAYNEQDNIKRVVENLSLRFPQYDYLVVNDGSSDNTALICREMGYRLLDLPVNTGLTGAFQSGMKYALRHDYDMALQFDADGQHLPDYIESMCRKMEEGYDIVIGSRFVKERKPISMRMLGSRMISAAIRLVTGKQIKDPTSGMRMYNQRMIRYFCTRMTCSPEPDTIAHLICSGAKVAEVQVSMEERIAGESYLNPIRSIEYMAKMMCSILFVAHYKEEI